MNKAQLAEALSVSTKTINRWENGHTDISRCNDFAIKYLILTSQINTEREEINIRSEAAWHAWNTDNSV